MEPIRIQFSTIDKRRRQARIAIEAPEEEKVLREGLLEDGGRLKSHPGGQSSGSHR
jgi:sRNA-binding carbon storage regulator CsrA